MKVSQAVTFWLNYHRANSSKNTSRAYRELLERFCHENGEKDLQELTSDEVLDFLNGITEGKKPQTRKTRFSHLTSFFNFTKNNVDQIFQNTCDSPIMKKMFRAKALAAWDILEKEVVDEIIFKTDIRNPYSFLKKIADRLKDYIRRNAIQPEERIFPICYETARSIVRKAGEKVGVRLRPHDLRCHAATFASRSGVPPEIISKIILRHINLSTTQLYLGKISDVEAIRWIENIHG